MRNNPCSQIANQSYAHIRELLWMPVGGKSKPKNIWAQRLQRTILSTLSTLLLSTPLGGLLSKNWVPDRDTSTHNLRRTSYVLCYMPLLLFLKHLWNMLGCLERLAPLRVPIVLPISIYAHIPWAQHSHFVSYCTRNSIWSLKLFPLQYSWCSYYGPR